VDISVTVTMCVCARMFVRFFAGQFIGVQGREGPIFGNFTPPEAQNRPANWPPHALYYK